MNRKHIGSSFDDHFKEMEKRDSGFHARVNKLMAKTVMAHLLKEARHEKGLSQAALAKKAGVPQSVIARIESPNNKTIPGMGIFSDIASALGYRIVLSLENERRSLNKAA